MNRKTFDKIVTSIGALLTVFLLVAAVLLNWGATFASDSVASQLEAQKITMPKAADFSPDTDPDVLAYFVSRDGELMSTGKDAQMYADHYIALHMSNMPTYAEASGAARSAVGEDKVAKEAIVETVFRGNMLRGTLLTAYAFWNTWRYCRIWNASRTYWRALDARPYSCWLPTYSSHPRKRDDLNPTSLTLSVERLGEVRRPHPLWMGPFLTLN